MDILCDGIWFWSNSFMPGPYRLIPGGRGMTELRRLAWSWPGAKFISLKEPRGIYGAVFTPSSPKKLLVLFAWRKGAGKLDALFTILGVAARLYMFLGSEGCIMGLCESWLSKLIFVLCYWLACIGFAIELIPAMAAELNCGVNMVVCPGSMNLCWGAKEDNRSDCIGDVPTPKNGTWLLTCIDWGICELTIRLGDRSGLTRF